MMMILANTEDFLYIPSGFLQWIQHSSCWAALYWTLVYMDVSRAQLVPLTASKTGTPLGLHPGIPDSPTSLLWIIKHWEKQLHKVGDQLFSTYSMHYWQRNLNAPVTLLLWLEPNSKLHGQWFRDMINMIAWGDHWGILCVCSKGTGQKTHWILDRELKSLWRLWIANWKTPDL